MCIARRRWYFSSAIMRSTSFFFRGLAATIGCYALLSRLTPPPLPGNQLLRIAPQNYTTQVPEYNDGNEPCWTILLLVPLEWEKYYIDDLLEHLPLCKRLDDTANEAKITYQAGMDLNATHFEHSILVTSIRKGFKDYNQRAMDALDKLSYQYVTFLISEETKPYDAACSAASPFRDILDRSALVIRNYWAKDCHNRDDVVTVPLLVARQAQIKGGWNEHCGSLRETNLRFGKPPTERKSLLYFASGHTMAHRTAFVKTVLATMPEESRSNTSDNKVILKYKHLDVYFNVDHGASYGAIMADAKFAAVLAGNVEETWRFTEALLCGAIPFLQKSVHDYYRPWLPADLVDLLPVYNGDDDLEAQLRRLFDEAKVLANYTAHNLAIRSAAQAWLDETRSQLLIKLRDVAIASSGGV